MTTDYTVDVLLATKETTVLHHVEKILVTEAGALVLSGSKKQATAAYAPGHWLQAQPRKAEVPKP